MKKNKERPVEQPGEDFLYYLIKMRNQLTDDQLGLKKNIEKQIENLKQLIIERNTKKDY